MRLLLSYLKCFIHDESFWVFAYFIHPYCCVPVEQDLVVPEVQRHPKRAAPDRRQERPQRRRVSANGVWQGTA